MGAVKCVCVCVSEIDCEWTGKFMLHRFSHIC